MPRRKLAWFYSAPLVGFYSAVDTPSGVGSVHSATHTVQVSLLRNFDGRSIPSRLSGVIETVKFKTVIRSGYRLSASRDVQLRATFLKQRSPLNRKHGKRITAGRSGPGRTTHGAKQD